jgi:hypothetical protein
VEETATRDVETAPDMSVLSGMEGGL